MFKIGCMARRILAPGSSGPSDGGSSATAGGPTADSAKGKNKNKDKAPGAQTGAKSTDELGDFSKLEDDPRLPLNKRQIFKITKSWKAIARTMSKTGTAMFLNLFEHNRDLFYLFERFQHLKGPELHESMELREHAATVMATLDQSINSLSDYDNFVTYLHSIGQLHRKVPGFKREHFWKIEQPFMKAVKQTLDERCNETIEEIYKIAIKLIIETIADGYGFDEPAALAPSSSGGPQAGATGGAPSTTARGTTTGPAGPTPNGAARTASETSRWAPSAGRATTRAARCDSSTTTNSRSRALGEVAAARRAVVSVAAEARAGRLAARPLTALSRAPQAAELAKAAPEQRQQQGRAILMDSQAALLLDRLLALAVAAELDQDGEQQDQEQEWRQDGVHLARPSGRRASTQDSASGPKSPHSVDAGASVVAAAAAAADQRQQLARVLGVLFALQRAELGHSARHRRLIVSPSRIPASA